MTAARVIVLRRASLGESAIVFRAHMHVDGHRATLFAEVSGGRLTPTLAAAAARIRDGLVASLGELGHHVVDRTNLEVQP